MFAKQLLFTVATLVAIRVFAQSPPASATPDKQNLSYALGMNLALESKESGIDLDAAEVARALRDVLQSKSTELQESQIQPILKQAELAARLKQSSRNIAEGEAFLAKNANAEGVTVLPDGLQYRVLRTGTGAVPKPVEILTLKFRGTWIDGKEFNHNDSLDIPLWGCPKGLHEVLLKMNVGSEWQVYVPYNLAYAHLSDKVERSGSTLIYDLELVNAESETARPNQHHGAGRMGHWLEEDLLPPRIKSSGGASK
jgi:FKBP-type peptidyl-prolyl cis-trans isomerase FklB